MEAGADARGRVPDFFVVGHPKSGTTALHAMLSQHPGVFLGLKEPRFFSTELHVRDLPRPGGTPTTLDEYRDWFRLARADQLVGDISPVYLWSKEAPRLIAEAQPQGRIVAIFREPAAFLRSLHRQWLRNYVEIEPDLRRALDLEPARREGKGIPEGTYWPAALMYSDQVRYVEQLKRYESRFPREQMLVLIYDDYRADGDATVRRLLRFLGLDESAPIVARESNPSLEVRSPRLHGAIRSFMVSENAAMRALKGSVKAVTPMRVRQRSLHAVRRNLVYGAPEAAEDEELMTELRRRFAPEVRALSEHLDRDLVSLWGYDRLE